MLLRKSQTFLIFCLTFIAASFSASFFEPDLHDLRLFIIFVILLLAAIFSWQPDSLKKIGWRLGLWCAVIFVFGLWRYALDIPVDSPDKIWFYNNQNVVVGGQVTSEPQASGSILKFEFSSAQIKINNQNQPVSGKILVKTNIYPEYAYGDQLEIKCQLAAPEAIDNFDYDKYLARYNIFSLCSRPQIKLLSHGGNWFFKNILAVKSRVNAILNLALPCPESTLASAVLTGDQRNIPSDLKSDFSITGTSHLMAISGMNISIVAGVAMALLLALGLSRQGAFYAATIFLILYLILIGLPASAVRAGIMGFLVLWALKLGRLNKLTNSLALAAAIMIFINPRLTRSDIGFQLSFLAIVGISNFYPLLENWSTKILEHLKWLQKKEFLNNFAIGIFEAINMTLAAQVFTLPILAVNFNQVSLVAPLTNLLILWTSPLLTIGLPVSVALGLVISQLNFLWFAPHLLLLKYMLAAVSATARIPHAAMQVESISNFWIIGYYILFLVVIFKINKVKFYESKIF